MLTFLAFQTSVQAAVANANIETYLPRVLPQCKSSDNPGDCDALVAFAYATKFQTWTKNDNWLLGGTVCDWYGVSCDTVGLATRVVGLEFAAGSNSNVVGKFPDQFVQLTELKKLLIEDNDFSSQPEGFPKVIAGLTKLTTLSLANNKISGNLPAWIGSLTNLQYLYLEQNQLTGNITGLGKLKQLKSIDLTGNQFTKFSNDVCDLPTSFFCGGRCLLGGNFFTCPLPYCVIGNNASNTVCNAACK
jgi:Leucine-rich repeat (LRR) protein